LARKSHVSVIGLRIVATRSRHPFRASLVAKRISYSVFFGGRGTSSPLLAGATITVAPRSRRHRATRGQRFPAQQQRRWLSLSKSSVRRLPAGVVRGQANGGQRRRRPAQRTNAPL